MNSEEQLSPPVHNTRLEALRPVLAAAGVELDPTDDASRQDRKVSLIAGASADALLTGIRAEKSRVLEELAFGGCLVLAAPGDISDESLAAWRNEIWPDFHATSIIRVSANGANQRTISAKQSLEVAGGEAETLLLAHRRDWVQSPEATVEKFDKNAAGWNGEAGKPGYAHHRWMRRYVGTFARPNAGERVLDFGCGAGWCGIETTADIPNVSLSSFDPSPEMIRITEGNARAAGIPEFIGRTGFGNAPPFPAEGEEKYDLVISSGVVSFAPSVEEFLEGLVGTLKPGATLVFGDINANSRGFRARRRARPLLPVREMNAQTAEDMRAWLEARGFQHEATAGYQLTWPIPEAMYFSERRLKGLLGFPLLLANRVLAGVNRLAANAFSNQFDSWVMRFRAPERPR